MRHPKALRAIIGASIIFGMASAHAAPIFTETFNNYQSGNFNGGQYQSGLSVAYGGTFSGWSRTGGNAAHVVDLDNSSNSNFAVMLWRTDVVTLNSAIAGSNVLGQKYALDFSASAAVYQGGSQQTSSTDEIRVSLLNSNGSVFQSFTYAPDAWTGTMAFKQAHFEYTGNGTGDLKIQLSSAQQDVYHFAGAVDNLTVAAVPEPETYAMLLAGLGIMGAVARRKKQAA